MFGMMQTQAACTKCGGEGTIIKNKCKECGGDGIVKGEELVEINIPAGVDNDMVVTVEGKGNQGKHNGLYGNLQVMVSVEKNDDFERVGQDLYHNLVLDFATATLGGEVEVPTLDGKTKIKIEPGTQPGKQIRLRGKGMPAIKGYGYGRGDIIVNITVFIPTSLTKEEKDLVVKFKKLLNIFSPARRFLKRLEPRHTNLGLIRCIKWMNTSDILITNINVSILQEPTEKVHHPIHLLQSCRARAIRSVCSHLHIL